MAIYALLGPVIWVLVLIYGANRSIMESAGMWFGGDN